MKILKLKTKNKKIFSLIIWDSIDVDSRLIAGKKAREFLKNKGLV